MTKKTSKWVTLPDEQSKSAAKKPKNQKTDGIEPVQHKLFWGISFVVLVVVSLALISPQQFADLIKGNLFDNSGIPPSPAVEQQVSDNFALLPEENVTDVPAEVNEPAPAEQVISEPAPANVVEETPIVQPTTQPEAIQIEPITAPEEINIPSVQEPEPAVLEPAPTIPETTDPNKLLLDKLAEQVNQLQQDELLPSAPEELPTTPKEAPAVTAEVPTVTATTALGQPTEPVTAVSGYRPNSYKVSIQPSVVLQQNQNLVSKAAAQPSSDGLKYQAQLANVQATPESGPAEVMIIAMIIALIGFTAYKVAPTRA